MKYFLLLTTVLLLLAPPASAENLHERRERERPRSQVITDIPLMDGMEEMHQAPDAKDPTKFKNPNQTTTVVSGNDKMVKTYYSAEFRKAGWKLADPAVQDVYVNGNGDKLQLQTLFANGVTTVTFTRIPGDSATGGGAGPQDAQPPTNRRGENNVPPGPDGE